MFFIALTFLAAFLIEGLGTLVSVIGLSALFGSNPIIIALAVALDLGKIVVVSFLYTYWKKLGVLMKTYALIASVVTMTITSAGAAGYLSGEFQKAILGTQESSLKVDVLKEQQAKYQERKKQIDDQIANLSARTSVGRRIQFMNAFKAEQQELDRKIAEIDKQLPELQIAQIGVNAKAGPILYVAKAFQIPVEEAVKWVILMIIFVFDPLAVFLIIAGNYLLHQRRTHHETKVADADLFADKEDPVIIKQTAEPLEELTPLEEKTTVYADFAKPEHNYVKMKQKLDADELELAPIEPKPEVVEDTAIEQPKEQELTLEPLQDVRGKSEASFAEADPGPSPAPVEPAASEPPATKAPEVTLADLGYPPQHIPFAEEVGYRTGAYKSRTK